MSQTEVARELELRGYWARPAHLWARPSVAGEDELLASWEQLVQDPHMADGGTYRFRRYSRMLWSQGQLGSLEGTSIFQELKDNPLNGGVLRTFEPIQPELLENPFLRGVVHSDAETLGLRGDWQVGIHCVRILARPSSPGLPTPEGIHRDAEHYTVQHLIARNNVKGGVFTAYDEDKRSIFHWLQLHTWDALFFVGSLWHSASPVESQLGGYRDILLVDFEPV